MHIPCKTVFPRVRSIPVHSNSVAAPRICECPDQHPRRADRRRERRQRTAPPVTPTAKYHTIAAVNDTASSDAASTAMSPSSWATCGHTEAWSQIAASCMYTSMDVSREPPGPSSHTSTLATTVLLLPHALGAAQPLSDR